MFLQLDPLDHHFDPEGQASTLWASTSWSTGSEGRQLGAVGGRQLERCQRHGKTASVFEII
jgi:hypothetical protein